MKLIVQLRNFKTEILAIWKHVILKKSIVKKYCIYLDYKNSYISDKSNNFVMLLIFYCMLNITST